MADPEDAEEDMYYPMGQNSGFNEFDIMRERFSKEVQSKCIPLAQVDVWIDGKITFQKRLCFGGDSGNSDAQ